jgi:hypothetical protein
LPSPSVSASLNIVEGSGISDGLPCCIFLTVAAFSS